jgi:RND family efflux transporter MFP subunit
LLLVSLTLGCSPETPSDEEFRRPVKTMVVTAGNELRVRSFPGKVEASRRVELAFQVPGLLVEFPVKEGQQIAQGELIGRLRQDEFQARLATLQGRLDQARATLRSQLAGERPEERLRREALVRAAEATLANARAELDRSTQMLSRRAISQQAHDVSETAYRVAQEEHQAAVQLLEQGTIGREEDIEAHEAQVRALEGQVVEANLQLQDTTLRAPYDGVIAERFVEEQQNVQAKQPVVRFQDVEEIEIIVDVPESVMVTDIRRAEIVQLVAELGGAPGIAFPVEIKEMSQVADPTTQTFRVRVAMKAPPDLQALPGMTATVTATYRRASILGEQLFIPISAVLEPNEANAIVWVIGPEESVTQRSVKVGGIEGGRIEILQGLNPGDRIAVAGVTLLREGMHVRDLGVGLGG